MSDSLSTQWLGKVAQASGPLTRKQLRKYLSVKPEQEEEFQRWIDHALRKGQLVKNRYDRYAVPEQFNLVSGRLEANPRGFAFVLTGEEPDFYVAPGDKGSAMHGDTVLVRPRGKRSRRKGQNPEGVVIRVLERANHRIVGDLSWRGKYGLVIPDDRRLTEPVAVDRKEGPSGEKVLVEIQRWGDKRALPEGRIVQRFGMPDSPGTQEAALMARYGLDPGFPDQVEREAENLKAPEPAAGRVDLTHLDVVAIDPAGARDFDDALSLEKTERGYRVGVHIADVSHYVPPGGAIDREAQRRGTSVYLVEQVVPMLPRRLSEDLCSLRAGTRRYAMTAMLEYDRGGRLLDCTLSRSLIRVTANLTYEEVQQVIDGSERSHPQAGVLLDLYRLSRKLQESRVDRGSIDFDLPEAEISLDDLGRPVDISPRHHDESHQLVENFMLAANQAVASLYRETGLPFMYRVHPEPSGEKLEQAADFLGLLGLRLEAGEPIHPRAFQKVLHQVQGRREERLVNMVLLRALPIAHYSDRCLGHFALALDEYCHFTSPIRRYPDLMIHRIVGENLARKRLPGKMVEAWSESMEDLADQCSALERRAEEAEREAKDIKKAQYMTDRVGEVFPGIISGVTEFGLFVQLQNGVEGLVHVSSLDDDYYVYVEEKHMLRGRRTNRMFRLGDPVKVQVTRASVAERQVDFQLDR